MPTSAPGNPEAPHLRQRGFTLLELLVVLSVVAVATAGVSMALPNPAATQLEREAQRLSALLEAARAQARTTGVAVRWRAEPGGFSLDKERRAWLNPHTQVRVVLPAANATPLPQLALGPEPLMPAQTLALSLEGRSVWVGTDGIRPFGLQTDPAGPAAP